jgi:hypothetical protein
MYSPNPRDREFDYYERMSHFTQSGAFDLSPGSPLEPEADTATYNGSVWLLARQTYWENPDQPPARESPEYLRAEAFYRARAVGEEDRWSWSGAEEAHTRFKREIRRSNDGFRDALQDIGIVIANHALSTVDALATLRLARRPDSGRAFTVTASIPF